MWSQIAFDSWRLQIEATSVIALRMSRLSAGGLDAGYEAERMVSEKVAMQTELALRWMTGGLGSDPGAVTRSVIRSYSGKVRANRRRLTRT